MESPLYEVIIKGNKVRPLKRPLQSPRFKEFTEDDVNIAKFMVRIHNIEAEEDGTRIEIKGV